MLRGKTITEKIRLISRQVKGEFTWAWGGNLPFAFVPLCEFAFGNSLGFQSQIEDLHFKCCILGDNLKNKSTGSNVSLSTFTLAVNETTSYDVSYHPL